MPYPSLLLVFPGGPNLSTKRKRSVASESHHVVIVTNIRVNLMARRLEGSIEKCDEEGKCNSLRE